MLVFANGEDSDEMPHHGAFYQGSKEYTFLYWLRDQGLHCLTRQKQSSEKEIQI